MSHLQSVSKVLRQMPQNRGVGTGRHGRHVFSPAKNVLGALFNIQKCPWKPVPPPPILLILLSPCMPQNLWISTNVNPPPAPCSCCVPFLVRFDVFWFKQHWLGWGEAVLCVKNCNDLQLTLNLQSKTTRVPTTSESDCIPAIITALLQYKPSEFESGSILPLTSKIDWYETGK
jgi:hypothetical protein